MPFQKSPPQSRNGFTLIEVAIALVVAGMILGGALEVARVYAVSKTYKTTRSHIEETNKSVALYLSRFGHLPCPAPLSAMQDSKEYGKGGDCQQLLSTVMSSSDDYIVSEGRNREKVIIGKLPFRDINLVQSSTRDGWNRDLYYAVSASLTQTDTYSQYAGVIDVVDSHDVTLTNDETGVQYVIYSTGSDDAPPDTKQCIEKRADNENCDGDGTFRYAPTALGPGPAYYDDIISYITWVAAPEMSASCSLPDYVASVSNANIDDIRSSIADEDKLYLNPGDMTFVCNRRILSALNARQCILFLCSTTGMIQRVETIE